MKCNVDQSLIKVNTASQNTTMYSFSIVLMSLHNVMILINYGVFAHNCNIIYLYQVLQHNNHVLWKHGDDLINYVTVCVIRLTN